MGSLAEFASSPFRSNKGGKCWTCGIPERDEIDQAHREKGIGPATVCDWLAAEKGYDSLELTVRRDSIKAHFTNRHHERPR